MQNGSAHKLAAARQLKLASGPRVSHSGHSRPLELARHLPATRCRRTTLTEVTGQSLDIASTPPPHYAAYKRAEAGNPFPLSPSFSPKNRATVQPHNLTGEPSLYRTADCHSSVRGSSLPCASLGTGFTAQDAPLRAPVHILPPPLPHAGELLSLSASSPSSFSNRCLMLVCFPHTCRTPLSCLLPSSCYRAL
jgi:hypothetical protein